MHRGYGIMGFFVRQGCFCSVVLRPHREVMDAGELGELWSSLPLSFSCPSGPLPTEGTEVDLL